MAIILNIETATTNCSVSLAQNGRLIDIREHNSASFSHSEQLHVFIEELLRATSTDVNGLDAIAVSKGPGSYTGLRIGVSAAKGLCFALDIPLIAIPTLESMAHKKIITSGVIIPVLDARRMEVYSAVYDPSFNEIRKTDAEIINSESFREYAEKDKAYLLGSGAAKCQELLKHPNFVFESELVPSAAQMCPLSYKKFTKGTFEDLAYFEPYYLKDFVSKPKP
ncbi:MAG: tRNA (adenosine(37)-N6)-threonylcarbamoyltransferase complex dimerization subunit type 1 TsaB [Eudoraea sp.]|nr:tRNA (adenosine(37)-N6)-threonylcarbamoyltransferase complex dimerization subunit type 1 TsaB [Eudoraea sp.]